MHFNDDYEPLEIIDVTEWNARHPKPGTPEGNMARGLEQFLWLVLLLTAILGAFGLL